MRRHAVCHFRAFADVFFAFFALQAAVLPAAAFRRHAAATPLVAHGAMPRLRLSLAVLIDMMLFSLPLSLIQPFQIEGRRCFMLPAAY